MLVIGLLLVLIAVALIVGAVYDGAEPATMEAFGAELDTTIAGVFFTGVGTTVLLVLGLWLLKSATSRSRKQRTERKQQRIRQRESVKSLERERNELRAENERLAKQAAAAGGPSAASSTDPSAAQPASERRPTSERATSERPTSERPTSERGPATEAPDLTPSGKHAEIPADEAHRRP